jgi:hypothetical protein
LKNSAFLEFLFEEQCFPWWCLLPSISNCPFSCLLHNSCEIINMIYTSSSGAIGHILHLMWILSVLFMNLCRNGLISQWVDPYRIQSRRTLHLVQLPAWCIQPQAWDVTFSLYAYA